MTEIAMPAGAVLGFLLTLIPLSYAAAALMPGSRAAAGSAALWARAQFAGGGALALSALFSVTVAGFGAASFQMLTIVPLGPLGALNASFRLDALTAIMLILVSFVGFIILRFSRSYLDGDPRQQHFVRWLMATLAAVTLLVISNNLLVLVLSWIATSLSLHRLLMFYPERVWAQIAAHKKFLVSRAADLSLLAATALIGAHFGTLELSDILPRAAGFDILPPGLQLAAVLLVLAAALKCAQLPFHGWLIQVMEAPTPVSALLHAGVINIGGFLMIRMAPLMAQSELAQTLLVVCGTTTAAVAALVMTTRVSVKVMLAWSTCAQMGFMLLECGLGAYSLALLHLVGHSLYKAHAFLSAGSAVDQWRTQAQRPVLATPGFGAWLATAGGALLAVAAVGALFGADPRHEPALWALTLIVALALAAPVLSVAGGHWRPVVAVAAASAGVTALYFTWHTVFGLLLPASATTPTPLQLAIVISGVMLLYLLSAAIKAYPRGRLAQWLQPHLFAGLYLDELFTRLTFRIWPARLPQDAPGRPLPAIAAPRHHVLNRETSS